MRNLSWDTWGLITRNYLADNTSSSRPTHSDGNYGVGVRQKVEGRTSNMPGKKFVM